MAPILILMVPMKLGKGVYWQSIPHMINENFDFTRFSPGGPGGPRRLKWDLVRVWACRTSKWPSGRGDYHATLFRSLRLNMRPTEPKTCKNRSNTVLFGTIRGNFHRVWACCTSKQPSGGGLSYATILRSLQPKLRLSEPKISQSRSKKGPKMAIFWNMGQIFILRAPLKPKMATLGDFLKSL